MSIKSKVIKTLVDKKNFTRQDIYRAIYKAQGKEIPNTFPQGFYGTNINHWTSQKLIERVSRGNYIIGKRAKLYLENPKEYRKVMKKEREEWRNYYHEQWEKRRKEAEKNDSLTYKHSKQFKHLIGQTIKQLDT